MDWLLLLTQALATAAWYWWAVFHEVPLNVRLILANGSADNLKAGFHQRRTWVRFWWWLGLTTAGSLAAGGPDFILAFGGLGALLGAIFLRTFNPLLNVGLGLAYKERFYASPVSASFPDAYVWRHVRKAFPAELDGALQARANFIHQFFLNMVLVGGVVLWVALVWLGPLIVK
jgi:hypothetical protein